MNDIQICYVLSFYVTKSFSAPAENSKSITNTNRFFFIFAILDDFSKFPITLHKLLVVSLWWQYWKENFHVYILQFSPNSNAIISMTGFFFGRMRKRGSPTGFQSILKTRERGCLNLLQKKITIIIYTVSEGADNR